MKRLGLLLCFSLGIFCSSAQDLGTFFNQTDAFLKKHVKNGKVDYNAISKNSSELNTIVENASKVKIKVSDAKKYQAFWINVYNLAVIKGLVENYPTKSPLDDKGFFDKTKYYLAGQKVTLNEIENELLRAKFKDPRFHFVLVCGALGCPPLISEAYFPETLDQQLTEQTRKAINGDFIKVSKKNVQVSEIMKWYKEDFTMNGTSEIDFINQYRTEKISAKAKISYFPYNWTINKQ
jgi:hypothetical protein